ncbi:MAG: pantoate--beta-alanine ligase, partial [Parvibaculum sp.]
MSSGAAAIFRAISGEPAMPLDTTSHKVPVARNAADLRSAVAAWRAKDKTVALVPTMGALHEGHL